MGGRRTRPAGFEPGSGGGFGLADAMTAPRHNLPRRARPQRLAAGLVLFLSAARCTPGQARSDAPSSTVPAPTATAPSSTPGAGPPVAVARNDRPGAAATSPTAAP